MTHRKTVRLLAAAFGLSVFLSASVYGEEAPSSPPDTTAARARMNAYLQDLRKADTLEQRGQALAKHWKNLPPEVQEDEKRLLEKLKKADTPLSPVALEIPMQAQVLVSPDTHKIVLLGRTRE